MNNSKKTAADWVASLAARLQAMRVEHEEGQALVEYGLIIALVALVCIAVLTVVGTDVSSVFSSIAGSL